MRTKKYKLLVEPNGWFVCVNIRTRKGTWFCTNDAAQAPEVLKSWGVPKYIIDEALAHMRKRITSVTFTTDEGEVYELDTTSRLAEARDEMEAVAATKRRTAYKKPTKTWRKRYVRRSTPKAVSRETYFVDFLVDYGLLEHFDKAK